ncbi:DUF4157 domain-containing protein [Adonisia turfae]|uniref:DUF4157 domain-containing protein n=1 Tax=Adonisia turfae TaxID=2950184 RepID=UPI0020299FEF|nr:DUF4157 domain-containing protein [Adonisia turfae]
MYEQVEKSKENKSQSVVNKIIQKQSGGVSTFQFVDNRPEAIAQRKLQEVASNSPKISQLRALQDMTNNGPQAKQTAQLQAYAYAQGTDIHIAAGQEKHLPQEAWHVVQQIQGRVKPTMQMNGAVNINDDEGLEKETDVMGSKVVQMKPNEKTVSTVKKSSESTVLQAKLSWTDATIENHESNIGGSFETYRNILDALRRYHTFWKVKDDNEPDIMIPRLELILDRCQSQLDTYPEENRNQAVKELMFFTYNEIERIYALKGLTGKDNLWQEYYDIEDSLNALIKSWNHWPITGLITAAQQLWGVIESKIERLKQSEARVLTYAETIDFDTSKSEMQERVNIIRAFIPVLDKGRDNLALAGQKLQEADQLLQTIDKLLIYHNTAGVARTDILAGQVNAQRARVTIFATQQNILAKQTNYDQRTAIDLNTSNLEQITQNGYNATLRYGIIPSVQTILNALNIYTADAQFQAASQYGNLNLTRGATSDPFWQSLTLQQRARLNQKINGFTPNTWRVAGYPRTRDKQNGYAGRTILIPTLTGGFPLAVSGEIVHDWIFNTPDHGHSAQKMHQLVTLALAQQPYQAGPNFQCQAQRNGGNPEVFTWSNLALQVIVANGNTLVTYYNAL